VKGIKNLVEVQNALGDRLGHEVFMYSITLDPEHDTPAVLKDNAKSHGAKWTFLTGKAEDIEKLRRKLGLFIPDRKKDSDRRNHTGLIRIGNEALHKWTLMPVLSRPQRILDMIDRVRPPTPP
jgi:protein SCO1/2